MNATLKYSPNGDFLLPDLILDEPPRELTEPLGRYAKMRKAYLKEHRTISYNSMLLKETLYPHLRETDELCSARMDQVMAALMEKATIPDKASDPMGWTAAMNTMKAQAEEVALHELVYA